MVPWSGPALHLVPERLYQRRWLQCHGSAQKRLARVLTLLTQFTWHFIGSQEVVQFKQSRQCIVLCCCRQTVGMGTKYQVTRANGVPAHMCQPSVTRQTVMYYTCRDV